MAYSNKFSIEIWNKNGQLLADYSGKAMSRRIVQSRNRPEDIQFTLDLDDFEQYCRSLGVDPKNIMIVNSAEVRVKRLGTSIVGGQINYLNAHFDARQNTLTVRAIGFLGLFNKRYTGIWPSGTVLDVHTAANGNAKSRTDLAWYLISASQALTNGNFGITRGLTGGSTTLYDKQYSRSNIMDSLINLTELQVNPIDVEFTPDKVFNTYASIGSSRPDIVFEFPGNITNIDAPNDGTDISNEVMGIGAGAADGTQITSTAISTTSQSNYQLRQEPILTSGTDNSDNGITDAAVAAITVKGIPLRIPALTVNANLAPYVTDYRIGDRVQVKITGHPTVSDVNGMYRIEKRTIEIDDNDNETVTLEVSL
jgi:hypothetical protein